MLDFNKSLEYSANLVNSLGMSKLSNGKTLAKTLTLNRIPFWDIFAVELARIYIPSELTKEVENSHISTKIKNTLIKKRYGFRDFINKHYSRKDRLSSPLDSFLCLDFSDHMSRDVLNPVVSHLTEQMGNKVVSIRDRPWGNSLTCSNPNSSYKTIWDYWNVEVAKEVSSLKRELSDIINYLKTSDDLKTIVRTNESSLWPKLENVFNRFFDAELPNLISIGVLAKHIIEKHTPKLVISADVADPRSRAFILLCKQIGIPCIEIQFGLAGAEATEWQFFSANKVAVWGLDAKKTMINHGIKKEDIIITGSPRHDNLINVDKDEGNVIRKKLKIPESSYIVLLASAYQTQEYDSFSDPQLLYDMKRSIFEAADKSTNIVLVVKPHPTENVKETKSIAGKNKNIKFVSQKSDIRELIRTCDAFISFGSTATVDALIARKLVVCPIFPGWIWSNLFKDSGVTLLPTNSKEIFKIFQLVANNKHEDIIAKLETKRLIFLSDWIHIADGMSTHRISEIAISMSKLNSNQN